MPKRCTRRTVIPWALSLLMLLLTQHRASAAGGDPEPFLQRAVVVDIQAQDVATALLELSRQAHVQVLMPGGSLDSYNASALQGRMPLQVALARLLQGTRHRFRVSGDHVLTIESEVVATKR